MTFSNSGLHFDAINAHQQLTFANCITFPNAHFLHNAAISSLNDLHFVDWDDLTHGARELVYFCPLCP